jgi:hypothetical protein
MPGLGRVDNLSTFAPDPWRGGIFITREESGFKGLRAALDLLIPWRFLRSNPQRLFCSCRATFSEQTVSAPYMRLIDLVPILQVAVGPVILISGVGLLLLSMTNRLGRVIDRSRLLAEASRKADAQDRSRLVSQLKVLSRRARLVRLAIILAALSVLLAAVLIIALFLAALLRWEIGILVVILFVGCMTSLIGSVIVFIGDINLSLSALSLEVEEPFAH